MLSEDDGYVVPERPPFSVSFPGQPGVYVRFTTGELIRLCEQLNAAGVIGLMARLDIFDLKALSACASVGIKTDEGVAKPRLEAISHDVLKEVVLEALSQRNFGKSTADVAADVARRNAEFVQPYLDPNPPERARQDEPREKASLDD